MEAAISLALKDVAGGFSLRTACKLRDAPYTSVQRQVKAMMENPEAWSAFKAATARAKPLADQATTETPPAPVSPLGPRLKRMATRDGDSVPYGQRGPWGMYREGVKEFTQKISNGRCTPSEASALLKQEGVSISEVSLSQKAKQAPGQSPSKPGPGGVLTEVTRARLATDVRFLRKHNLPVTKGWVMGRALVLVQELQATADLVHFPGGRMSDHVYYKFLDDSDMSGGSGKPLESDRDLWLTSTVCTCATYLVMPLHARTRTTHAHTRARTPTRLNIEILSDVPCCWQNAETQYAVWAGIALRNEMAIINPNFDPTLKYSEPILWTASGKKRLLSMDETDVRSDQTKRQRSMAARSVLCHAPASRKGHCSAKAGRKGKVLNAQKGGFVEQHSARKHSSGIDKGDLIVTKSASKFSWAGGSLGNGQSLSPLVMSKNPLTAEQLDAGPKGTAMDESVSPPCIIPAAFNINNSGGMEKADMGIFLHKIALPSSGVTPTNRGMLCLDGLGQHHCFQVVTEAIAAGLDIALRFPHGSSRNQKEDFENFATFCPAHEAAKSAKQIQQFEMCMATATAEDREPSRAELLKASVLTDSTAIECAKVPWETAFADDANIRGWKTEGVVPFTRKLYWDLKEAEEAKGIVVSKVPPPDLASFGLGADEASAAGALALPVTAKTLATSAVLLAPPVSVAWDAGIDSEVEMLLRAERGNPELNVPPVPAPPKMPKPTSALLFKVPGGVTGEIGTKLIRAKEIERRLGIARTKLNTTVRDEKQKATDNSDWTSASGALALLKANQFDLSKLNKPQLQALVRVLKVGNAAQNKGPLQEMLHTKFCDITPAQFATIETTVHRGVALALLPLTHSNPPALPAPELGVVTSPQPELGTPPLLEVQ